MVENSDSVEIEFHPEEAEALRGIVNVYREKFLPHGSDDPEDKFMVKLVNGIHEKLQAAEIEDVESAQTSETEGES